MIGENNVTLEALEPLRSEEKPTQQNSEVKLYKIRWVVLTLFFLYGCSSAVQWVQYSIITNIIMRYYSVTSVAVDWTSMIAMITYPPLMIPGFYFVDKMGLRFSALSGVIGTAIGTWIKVFSVSPDRFWVTFLGQTVVFVSQIFILSMPPKIAAVWFGPNEVSTATSIGVIGQQLGNAIGFILPPMIVKNHDNLDDIGRELSYMFYGVAAYTTPIVILVYFFCKSQPDHPPSQAQAYQRLNATEFTQKQYWRSYKQLLSNKAFWLLMVSYGMNIGVYAGICTLLNQFILSYFKNAEEDAGRMGLLLVVFGIFGSLIFGIILDRTKKFKETTLGLYTMTVLGVLSFSFALETRSKAVVYASVAFLGFFQNAYYPAGFEFAAELTYPQPESTSSGLIISMSQVFGVIFTLALGVLLKEFGTFWALCLMVFFLFIGCCVTVIIPNDLRRQKVDQKH
nr:uncharacterized MFS-type transporter C09D4.1-like [Onthophagus taurus]